MKRRNLAIIGARGIGHHGGFETVVAELAPRLSMRGLKVHCSVRDISDDASAQLKGVSMMRFPLSFPKRYSIGKIFEVLYDSYFVVKSKFNLRCDTVYCLGVTSGLALLVTKWSRSLSAVNIDGLEWRREKFSLLERFFLRMSFFACCIGCDCIVLDNKALITHVPRRFRHKAVCISYGTSPIRCPDNLELDTSPLVSNGYALEKGEYWLVVARLEPENNIHIIIEAYLSSGTAKKLVLVGDCSSSLYERKLSGLGKGDSEKKVIMVGSIYNPARLEALRCGCFAYIHGHSVGGTNPSLLEAMSAGNIIVCHENVFNREVCSNSALYFTDVTSLREAMDRLESEHSQYSYLGRIAKERVERYHKWDAIVADHEKLFSDMASL